MRDQLLADAALTGDQHVAGRPRGQRDLLAHGADRVALADECAAGGSLLQRTGHEPILPDRLAVVEQAPHPLLEVLDLEGLLEEVAGTAPKRADRGLERGVRGHHDDRRTRVEQARPLEHFEPVHAGHDDVGENYVEVLLLDAGQCLFPAPSRRDLVPFGREREGQNLLDRLFIVHDKDRCGHPQNLPSFPKTTQPWRCGERPTRAIPLCEDPGTMRSQA